MGRVSDARERLLEAALALIWERSYGVVSVDAICERAGVKKGSFYYFFESKSALAAEALLANWERCGKPKWDELFSPSVPPLERLNTYFQYLLCGQEKLKKECGQVLGCPCFTLGSEISTSEEAICAAVQKLMNAQLRYLESTIRDGQAEGVIAAGDAHRKAQMLYALIEGSLTQARIHNDVAILRDLPQAAAALLGVAQ